MPSSAAQAAGIARQRMARALPATDIRSKDGRRVRDRRPVNRPSNPGLYPTETEPPEGMSYTPSPTVAGNRPGMSGGIWRDRHGAVLGTAENELARVRPVKQRVKGLGAQRRS